VQSQARQLSLWHCLLEKFVLAQLMVAAKECTLKVADLKEKRAQLRCLP